MKNQRILLISSFLLILCVYEKQASDKAARTRSVEKMYNFPDSKMGGALLSTHNSPNTKGYSKKLYDFTRNVEQTQEDSLQVTGGSGKMTNQAIFQMSLSEKPLEMRSALAE